MEYIYGNGQMISRDDLLVLPVSKRLVYQNTHWFQQDGLGSIVNLTESNGNAKLTYNYDAFGEITKEEGAVGWKKNRYTFTGKPYDPEASMYYFGARFYDPHSGRFITKDSCPIDALLPISIKTNTLHKYLYCANNPVNWVDPIGFYRQYHLKCTLVTGAEIKLILLYYADAQKANQLAQEALRIAQEEANSTFSQDSLWNGEGDAYRHALWNAMMVRELGVERAKQFGDAHEDFEGNDSAEKTMDLYNNEIGRRLGADPANAGKDLREIIKEALKKVELMTAPGMKVKAK